MIVEQRELPLGPVDVTGNQNVKSLLWSRSAPQQRQPHRSMPRVAESLRRDHADLRPPIRNEAPDARKLRLHHHTKITVGAVAAENAERHPMCLRFTETRHLRSA